MDEVDREDEADQEDEAEQVDQEDEVDRVDEAEAVEAVDDVAAVDLRPRMGVTFAVGTVVRRVVFRMVNRHSVPIQKGPGGE